MCFSSSVPGAESPEVRYHGRLSSSGGTPSTALHSYLMPHDTPRHGIKVMFGIGLPALAVLAPLHARSKGGANDELSKIGSLL